MKRTILAMILFISFSVMLFSCEYYSFEKDGKKWHRRIYTKQVISFFKRKKKREKFETKSISMSLNPNENSEEIFLLDLDNVNWSEYILSIKTTGFYYGKEYSEKLTEATKFYLINVDRPEYNLVMIDENWSWKFSYIKWLSMKNKLALKVVYDTELINNEWYKVKSGEYINKISFNVEEYLKHKKNRSSIRRGNA